MGNGNAASDPGLLRAGHSPNPSWGTGTIGAQLVKLAARVLLTPHGERERFTAELRRQGFTHS